VGFDRAHLQELVGRVRGTIQRKVTRAITFQGSRRHASEEEPQYSIKSDQTDHLAIHKGSALKKLNKGSRSFGQPPAQPRRREGARFSAPTAHLWPGP
jgi:hypothetical protein